MTESALKMEGCCWHHYPPCPVYVIFGTGEEGMDTPSRVAPGTNPKLFFEGQGDQEKKSEGPLFQKIRIPA